MPDQTEYIGNYLTAYVPKVDDAIDLGYTVVRFYVATTEGGSYSLAGTATLASGTYDYSYNDTTGNATDWWYWAFYGATPGLGPTSEPQPVGHPRVTRKQIRQAAGKRLRKCETFTLASASSATVVVVSELIDADASVHRAANRFARLVSGTYSGASRRVRAGSTGYAVATGTLTVVRTFGGTPSTGDELELWKPDNDDDPSVAIDAAIDRARYSLWWEDEWLMSVDGSVSEYTLPQTIYDKDQVKAVEYVAGSYPDEPDWRAVPAWTISKGGGVCTLEIGRSGSMWVGFSASTIVRVRYNRYGDAMDSDTDWLQVPLEWAAAETAYEYLKSLAMPGGAQEDVRDALAALKLVETDVMRFRNIYLPSVEGHVELPR